MLDAKHVFTEDAIDAPYSWPCIQRANFPANADIWHLRFHWLRVRQELLESLHKQDYTFLPPRETYFIKKSWKISISRAT
jgi:RNA-directed DNA polymerase